MHLEPYLMSVVVIVIVIVVVVVCSGVTWQW
jgi:hypothetical protein